jgi:hypothetical protein
VKDANNKIEPIAEVAAQQIMSWRVFRYLKAIIAVPGYLAKAGQMKRTRKALQLPVSRLKLVANFA